MYELSVALKYLTPKRGQLSVSIISLISVLVIALVVWLVVLFFSVTHGLEKSWTQKLIAATAPLRLTPTDAYYHSYYYLSDAHSSASDYSLKSLSEKLASEHTDPYDPLSDGELPTTIPKPDLNNDGSLKDIVKQTHTIAQKLDTQDLTISDFEITISNLVIDNLSQVLYLGSYDSHNDTLLQTLLPISHEDVRNLLINIRQVHQLDPAFMTYLLNEHIIGEGLKKPPQALPKDFFLGEAILLPKNFRKAGVLLGDKGYLTYYAPTLSSIQQQRSPIYVAGFYDPGILPIGSKFAIANRDLVSTIHANHSTDEASFSTGFYMRFHDLEKADDLKAQLVKNLREAGLDKYWRIETYREYEFTKDLLQQLRSERNLWTLLATIIIIVACSNIISMLIILVNDKKIEIGILRAMGASSRSIAIIFGLCGMFLGMIGSILGMFFAYITLQNLQSLVNFIGKAQGFEMFNPIFYGNTLPNQISPSAIIFVVATTTLVSLLAGLVPAIKAGLLKPAAILRSE